MQDDVASLVGPRKIQKNFINALEIILLYGCKISDFTVKVTDGTEIKVYKIVPEGLD